MHLTGTPLTERGVLLMAYGTPENPADVEAYFTHIRGGQRPSAEAVANLAARYARIGGATPLRRITEQVRDGLAATLAADGTAGRVYVGMKHWHPFIADTVRRMHDDGVRDVVALALAPHYSRMSVGAYVHAVEEANDALPAPLRLRVVESWYQQPEFVTLLAGLVRNGLDRFPPAARASTAIVFTAHSLPIRIREWGDRYEAELAQSCALVAQGAGIGEWRFAWQSAGGTREPWLGPDVLEYLETLRRHKIRHVLQVPIGFVCEHLEILYDIDIEAKEKARALDMVLERTELPNASPAFVHALGQVVRRTLAST